MLLWFLDSLPIIRLAVNRQTRSTTHTTKILITEPVEVGVLWKMCEIECLRVTWRDESLDSAAAVLYPISLKRFVMKSLEPPRTLASDSYVSDLHVEKTEQPNSTRTETLETAAVVTRPLQAHTVSKPTPKDASGFLHHADAGGNVWV